MRYRTLLIFGLLLLAGCQTWPRRSASPDLIGAATPDGFPSETRLVTTDLGTFASLSPSFFDTLQLASTDGTIDILALSGGGSGGAYGGGVLAGMTQAHTRPQFELVTGVSAGALLAPFAFLGSEWDERMHQALAGPLSAQLLPSPTRTVLARLLSPHGKSSRSTLFQLVDHFVTPQMIEAIASESAKGRHLIVATTDLDKHETVLWNLGVIARQGGTAGRQLFRDVLIASASVPGIFPPVLIRVSDGDQEYDEMHVDGGVTTSVFSMPMIAEIQSSELPQLRGATLYMIVNAQIANKPQTTRYNTLSILSSAFVSGINYKTREAVINNMAAARRLGMQFQLTLIPSDYPTVDFINFDLRNLQGLFDYAYRCAMLGQVWMSPVQSVRRNMNSPPAPKTGVTECPAMLASSSD